MVIILFFLAQDAIIPCLLSGRIMRIEDFTYYKHTREGYVRIDDKPFDTFASGLCRTHYDFDTCNHTMTLIGVESAFESDTTVYYFRDGKVYEDTNEFEEKQ